MFYLEVSHVQGLKGASIVKVVAKGYHKVGVCDGGDKGQMSSGGWERVESVAIDWDVDRKDRGDFYSRWR